MCTLFHPSRVDAARHNLQCSGTDESSPPHSAMEWQTRRIPAPRQAVVFLSQWRRTLWLPWCMISLKGGWCVLVLTAQIHIALTHLFHCTLLRATSLPEHPFSPSLLPHFRWLCRKLTTRLCGRHPELQSSAGTFFRTSVKCCACDGRRSTNACSPVINQQEKKEKAKAPVS